MHTDQSNNSVHMKSSHKEWLSKYGSVSKSILKDRDPQIKNNKDEKRNNSYLVKKKEQEACKPYTPYTSKYVKEYLSAKY